VPDVYDKATRRRVMQRIRKADTKPELEVRSALHWMGFRLRLHLGDLPGTPDTVLPHHQLAIFVLGCFWHQHTCPLGKEPKSNLDYWLPKLARTCQRERGVKNHLVQVGWYIMVMWECHTRCPGRLRDLLLAELETSPDRQGDHT